MEEEMICICCPVGCHLAVNVKSDHSVEVSGNRCPKGEVYGRNEVVDPRRTVTAVVKTNSPEFPFMPVKTASAIPKDRIPKLLSTLYGMTVEGPLDSGKVVINDFDGTGIDVVLTRGSYRGEQVSVNR